MVDLDFCITYLKSTISYLVTYLTATKILLVYPVNCCSNYTNIVTQYTLVFLVYFGLSTITKTFLLNVVWQVVAYKTFVPLQPR